VKTLDPTELDEATGGMKTDRLRSTYNVDDRRRGAPPRWRQVLDTWWANVRAGYLW
jgi:hypothetical protein